MREKMTLKEFIDECIALGATMDSPITITTWDGGISLAYAEITLDEETIDVSLL